jgi:hypothetical protein
MGRAAVLLLLAAAAHGGDRIERWDDGKRAGKQSVAVSGHAITHEASAERPFVRSVLVHGARYGDGYDPARTAFEVAICDEGFEVLARVAASYGQFVHNVFTWVEVPLPQPVRVPPRYRVVVDFHATATRGVYVGYADVKKSHSCYFRLGEREETFARGKDWMIRVRTSASAEPLPRAVRNAREALRAARLPGLEAEDLASMLRRLSEKARVPIVLDGSSAAAPAVPAGSAEAALERLAAACGFGWDTRWGVIYVAPHERLARIPVAPPDPAAEAPTPPAAVALESELARRWVELACDDVSLEEAVAQVAGWLEFGVRWDPRVDREQRVSVGAKPLRARDALSLLLFPRGCRYRVAEGVVEILPSGG